MTTALGCQAQSENKFTVVISGHIPSALFSELRVFQSTQPMRTMLRTDPAREVVRLYQSPIDLNFLAALRTLKLIAWIAG
jgi:hypothetical protein